MSTIEEAREQAREALQGALARLVAHRLGRSLAREADKDLIALRASVDAILVLLDATKPPAPSSGGELVCTCPSGDGSLRWPYREHMPDCSRCGASLSGRNYGTAQKGLLRGAYCHDDGTGPTDPSCYEKSEREGFPELGLKRSGARVTEPPAIQHADRAPITEEELDAMAQRFQEVSRVGIICTGKREIIAGLIAALETVEEARR